METPKKILIVDDDKFLIDMYSMKFKKAGLNVTNAENGAVALQKLKEGFEPDILVLDVIMPAMDGIELLENIRKEKLVPNSIIVVLSNQGESTDIERAQQFNVHGYIVKATTIPSEVVSEVMDIYKKNKE
jgi:CheY-like chemotaxis protein